MPSSLKFTGQAGRKILAGVDTAILSSRAVQRQNSFLPRGPQSFLVNPSTDWMRPTHIIKSSLIYPKSTDLNLKRTCTATPRLVFDQTTKHHGSAKLTHKSNYHTVIDQKDSAL